MQISQAVRERSLRQGYLHQHRYQRPKRFANWTIAARSRQWSVGEGELCRPPASPRSGRTPKARIWTPTAPAGPAATSEPTAATPPTCCGSAPGPASSATGTRWTMEQWRNKEEVIHLSVLIQMKTDYFGHDIVQANQSIETTWLKTLELIHLFIRFACVFISYSDVPGVPEPERNWRVRGRGPEVCRVHGAEVLHWRPPWRVHEVPLQEILSLLLEHKRRMSSNIRPVRRVFRMTFV